MDDALESSAEQGVTPESPAYFELEVQYALLPSSSIITRLGLGNMTFACLGSVSVENALDVLRN